MELTVDFAYKEFQQILRDKVLVVVGSGASMALDRRFGMKALSDQLLKEIPGTISGDTKAEKQWQAVSRKLKEEIDLESALKEVTNEFLHEKIIDVTGNFLAELDKKYKLRILNEELKTFIGIGNFIQKLMNGRPEYDPILDVVTPNYDMLIEHCCDKWKIPYVTGFWGGLKKHADWEEALQQMTYTTYVPKGKKLHKVERVKRHIRLFKVHGSINRFTRNGEEFEDNTLVYIDLSGSGVKRLIIIPGNIKYRDAFNKTFDCIARANEEVDKAGAFVFVGYGFNDDHIHQRIERQLVKKKKPGIIITKKLTANAENLLTRSNKMWAIYQDSSNNGSSEENDTMIFNVAFGKPLEVKASRLWDIGCFSREVLGD